MFLVEQARKSIGCGGGGGGGGAALNGIDESQSPLPSTLHSPCKPFCTGPEPTGAIVVPI